jgi:hypothetical protein
MIREFLEPAFSRDKDNGKETFYYDLMKVEEAENSTRFRFKIAEKKLREQHFTSRKIKFEIDKTLVEKACRYYNDYCGDLLVSPKSDKNFLRMIIVEYLYMEAKKLHGSDSQIKILNEIAIVYPWLQKECRRQIEARTI